MVRISEVVIGCVNIFFLFIGIGILVMKHAASCFSLLYGPLITLAPMLIVLSVLALVGICFDSPSIMWLYLLFKLVVILVVAFGVILDMIVLGRGFFKAEMTPTGTAAAEVDSLTDYSIWLRNQVVGMSDWSHVKKCLIHKDICFDNANKPQLFRLANKRLFRQHRIGCCHPPSQCGFDQVSNGTYNQDCSAWKNNTAIMCYNCESCKAGFLADLTLVWGEMFPFIAALHIVLIILFTVSCQAFRRSKAAHYEKRYSSVKNELHPSLENLA